MSITPTSLPKSKVFITRRIPEAGLELLRPSCDIEVWPDEMPPPREVMLNKAPNIEGLFALITDRVDREFMDAAPNLKVISNLAVGYDNIDVGAATARGIPVGNTPGVLTEATADLAFALLLATARQLIPGAEYVHAGKWKTWSPLEMLGPDVHHATLGIVGLGRIGLEVAKRAKGFDMRVLYYNTRRATDKEEQYRIEYRDLDDLLAESDFVSLHAPLTPETHHLMNKRRLGLMKKTAVLINTARGPVVDPDALYDALSSHAIWAAGLDVTEPEPLPATHRLLTLRNCIVVPHLGSASFASRDGMARMAAENLLAGLEGRRLTASPNQDELVNAPKATAS